MNILNLQVKLKKVKIKTNHNAAILFSLRLGRVLSGMSVPYANDTESPICPDLELIVGCEQEMISNNSRASLVIYEAKSNTIVGMVFVLLKNPQGEVQRYKVQQSSDPDSYVELSFAITNMQVKQNQNKSLASKSSQAQIRYLHRVLSRQHQRSQSDGSDDDCKNRKTRISPQDKERQLRSFNLNKIPHLKSQQSPFGDEDDDPSYAILLKKAQNQLTKQKQKNSILFNLLAIEQQKNKQSQNFIKKFVFSINEFSNKNQIKEIFALEQSQKQKQKTNTNSMSVLKNDQKSKPQQSFQQFNGSKHTKQKSSYNNFEFKIQTLTKERDQLYGICQQLYEKTKKYKVENQKIYKNIKNYQNQLQVLTQQNQDLKTQNKQLKTKYFQLCDKKEKDNKVNLNFINDQLKDQIQTLKNQNIQYQRKFKQSLKFIEQFKNDALNAHQQIYIKDQQITSLREQLQNIKNNSRNRQQSREFSSCQQNMDQKQIIKSANENFQLMSTLILKNNIQRSQILEILSQRRKFQNSSIQTTKIIKQVKQKVQKLYRQYQKQNKRSINIIQMRKKFMEIINQTNF